MVYSPNDLYKAKSLEETSREWNYEILEILEDFFIDFYPSQYEDLGIQEPFRLVAKKIADPYIDGRRICTLGTLWFDDKPFAVYQKAGREGRDHQELFVTHKQLYIESRKYLESFRNYDGVYPIDPCKPYKELTNFYGHSFEL